MYKLAPMKVTNAMGRVGEIALQGVIDLYDANSFPDSTGIYAAMLDAAPNPWRPISEAPKDGTYILARRANDRPTPAVVVFWRADQEAWSDGYSQFDSQAFDGFIPLEWLGSPEGK